MLWGLFGKSEPVEPPEPSPIERLCESLARRPWEWKTAKNPEGVQVDHLSGTCLLIGPRAMFDPHVPVVYIGAIPGRLTRVRDKYAAQALEDAFTAYCSARTAVRRSAAFDDVAKAMAQTVLDGNTGGAYALADWIKEHIEQPTEGGA